MTRSAAGALLLTVNWRLPWFGNTTAAGEFGFASSKLGAVTTNVTYFGS